MAENKIDRKYINRQARTRSVFVFLLLLFTVIAGFFGVTNVRGLAEDLTATYTSTTGEVIEEGTQRVLEGGRRSKQWVDRRNVTIEFTVAGDSTTDTVMSETIQVGETLPIWVHDQTGDVLVEAPSGPDFWQWFWAVSMVIITVLLAWGAVVSVRTSIRLLTFQPGDRQPDFVLTLQDIAVVTGKRNKRTLQFKGITDTNVAAVRIGQRAQLSASAENVPEAATYPAKIPGYYLKAGVHSVVVVVHTPELGAWWVADILYPADLEGAPKADEIGAGTA